MQSNNKLLAISTIAILAAALISMSAIPHEVDAQKSKQSKAKTCNNVKVQVRVSGVEENQTVVATVQIGESAKTKTGTVEINETSITIPITFKKISPCPELGTPFFGNVNGTGFEGELKSTKKPNVVKVEL